MKHRGTVEATDSVIAPIGSYSQSLTISGSPVSTGTGGTVDHVALLNLDYASAGHTGFASSTDLSNASGTLSAEIDSDIGAHTTNTEAHHPRYTSAENEAITGSDGNVVVSGSSTIDVGGFRAEFVSASGILQSDVDGKVSKSGDTMTGPLYHPAGSVSVPSIAWSSDGDTGFYRLGVAPGVGISVGGSNLATFLRIVPGANGLLLSSDARFFSGLSNDAGSPSYSFINHVDSGLYFDNSFLGVATLRFSTVGVNRAIISANEHLFTGNLSATKFGAVAGSAAAPSYIKRGFYGIGVSDADTGMYFPANDELGLSVGGVARLVVSGTGKNGVGIEGDLTVTGDIAGYATETFVTTEVDSDAAVHAAIIDAHHTRYTKDENDAIIGGTNVTVVSGANTITINSAGGGGTISDINTSAAGPSVTITGVGPISTTTVGNVITISGVDVVPGWRGAVATTISGISSPNSSNVDLPWDNTRLDTDGFFNPSGNDQVLTIPAGINKVKISASVLWSFHSVGYRQLQIREVVDGLNRTNATSRVAATDSSSGSAHSVETAVMDVFEGDQFFVRTRQNSGSTLTMGTTATFFSLEVVDPVASESPNELSAVSGTFSQTVAVGNLLALPSITDSEKSAIPSPQEGYCIFNTTSGTVNVHDGSSWRELAYS